MTPVSETESVGEAPAEERLLERAVPLRSSEWPPWAVWMGCLVPLCLPALGRFFQRGPADLPAWIWAAAAGLSPHLLFLVFPLVTRRPRSLRLVLPSLVRMLWEGAVAAGVVLGSLFVLALANAALQSLDPAASLEARNLQEMAQSSDPRLVTTVLIFSFLIAPFSEELYFRGFLYNALRARMPFWTAAIIQALVFGFGHTFGIGHAFAASGLGLVFALLYEWRKTLVTPILAHGMFNSLASIALFGLMASAAETPVLGVNGQPDDRGCVVEYIAPESAAAKAGLQVGDVIIAIDDTATADYPALAAIVRSHKAGEQVNLTVLRGQESLVLPVVLQRRGP